MQETWMRVAARTGIDRPASFLDRVARNLAHDHLRSLVVQRVSGSAALEVLACHEPAPDQVLLGRERVRRAKAALATMPPRRRTVFLAVRLEGMPHAAVAARFGISQAAVEKHVARAALATAMDDDG